MPTTVPAMVAAGVPPRLEGATVTVATVTVADAVDCGVNVPDDARVVKNAVDGLVLLPVLRAAVAEDSVVAGAPLILK